MCLCVFFSFSPSFHILSFDLVPVKVKLSNLVVLNMLALTPLRRVGEGFAVPSRLCHVLLMNSVSEEFHFPLMKE